MNVPARPTRFVVARDWRGNRDKPINPRDQPRCRFAGDIASVAKAKKVNQRGAVSLNELA